MITVKRILKDNVTKELIEELKLKFPKDQDNPNWNLEKTIEFVSNLKNYLFLGYFDGELAAFTYGYDNDRFDSQKEFFIYEVATADEYQRKGIMRKVFEVMLDQLKEEGFKNAWVLTDKTNVIGNAFYKAVGGEFSGDESIMYEFRLD